MGRTCEAENSCTLSILANLQAGGASAVSKNHGIAIVHVDDARERFGTDYQCLFGHPCLQVCVGNQHALNPSWASRKYIKGNGTGVDYTKVVLDPRGNRGQLINAAGA